jgi:hypothetical protein
MNNYDMWIKKRENETLEYKCSSRWTSDRKRAAMENRPANDPGVVVYNSVLIGQGITRKWRPRRITLMICRLSAIRSVLNWVSSRYWLDPGSDEDDEGTQERVSRVDRSLVVEASYFTLDECDKIPVCEV